MNWKSILATGLVTAIVTIGTGIFLFWWQTKEPELTYNYVRSIPFDDSGSQVFIQQFEVSNSGDETAEDITLIIRFPESQIEKSNIRIDNAIKYQKDIKDDSVTLSITSLNPNEGLSLSVLLKNQSTLASEPEVSLRAKGIVGEKIGATKSEIKPAIGIALAAAYAGIFAFMLSNKRYREIFPLVIFKLLRGGSISSGSQKDNIASLLSLYGFPEKAREYLNSGSARRYWVEADLIGADAIASNEKDRKNMLNVLVHLAEEVDMASSSKAVVHYNIARIQKSLNLQFQEQLDQAKSIDEKEINIRLKRDPLFSQETSNK
ncbi:hypothetical protein ABMA57_09495 [Saccharospirillum sp. HFRX-1]|uniref:hypothetical protein n=1 Tax=unclassified Saccharospirillum TaxID=2633430 RepID=UPI0037147D49